MPHTQSAPHKRQAAPPKKSHAAAAKSDAISVLSKDHQDVKQLFAEFEKLRTHKNVNDKKKELVKKICVELSIHTKAEEELFYPVAREIVKDGELLDEADVEHAGAKELIQQLQSMSPSEDHYDAKVIVLQEYIEHHVKEEEGKIFPLMKKAKIDIDSLGEQILQRKEELHSDLAEVEMSMLSKS